MPVRTHTASKESAQLRFCLIPPLLVPFPPRLLPLEEPVFRAAARPQLTFRANALATTQARIVLTHVKCSRLIRGIVWVLAGGRFTWAQTESLHFPTKSDLCSTFFTSFLLTPTSSFHLFPISTHCQGWDSLLPEEPTANAPRGVSRQPAKWTLSSRIPQGKPQKADKPLEKLLTWFRGLNTYSDINRMSWWWRLCLSSWIWG